MAGCFGNHPVDRWMEQQLNNYLNDPDNDAYLCEKCGYVGNSDDWDYDEENHILLCPEKDCDFGIKL
jgi:hypothetical protein